MTDIELEVWKAAFLLFGIIGTFFGLSCAFVFAHSMIVMNNAFDASRIYQARNIAPWEPDHSHLAKITN